MSNQTKQYQTMPKIQPHQPISIFPLKSTASPRPAPTPPGKAKSERDDSAMALATRLPDASGDPKGKPKKPMKTWWKHL